MPIELGRFGHAKNQKGDWLRELQPKFLSRIRCLVRSSFEIDLSLLQIPSIHRLPT